MHGKFYAFLFLSAMCVGCASADLGNSGGSKTDTEKDGQDGQDVTPEPTCTDNIQNGNETGVDCGGICAPCVVVDPNPQAKPGEIVITEVLNSVDPDKTFIGSSTTQNEFIELYNRSAEKLSLNGNIIKCTSKHSETSIELELAGEIASKNAVVVSFKEMEGLPAGVRNVLGFKKQGMLLDNESYSCILKNKSGDNIHSVYVEPVDEAGVSSVLPSLDAVTDSNLFVSHDSVSRLVHSPGRCKNGGLFIDDCETHCTNAVKDADETDVNCGGAACDLCEGGKQCVSDADCTTGKCLDSGICAYVCQCNNMSYCDENTGNCWSCNDFTKNGDETGVDCGGSSCPACNEGESCSVEADCKSGICTDGICEAESCQIVGCAEPSATCDTKTGKCFYCNNNVLDGNETDVDCGGACSAKCAEGKKCETFLDCESQRCLSGVCAKKPCTMTGCAEGALCDEVSGMCYSCFDGVLNGDETDVDCGGSCGACAIGKVCKVATDCISTECAGSVCTGEELGYATPDDLVVNEFMAAEDTTSTSKSFFTINGEKARQCKFIEIVNVSSRKLRLNGCSVVVERTDTAKSSTNVLTGALDPKGVLVIHNCESLSLPEGVREQALSTPSNLTQTASYKAYVTCNDVSGVADEIAKATKGTSMNRQVELDSSMMFVPHTSVATSVAVASPGYCANGGLFSEDCDNHCDDGERDGLESDVDCGGRICGKCGAGKRCASGSDCLSERCESGVCAEQSCTIVGCEDGYTCDGETGECISCRDGMKNGDETDVDCGGKCGRCATGKACNSKDDCASYACEGGVCAGKACEEPIIGELTITEVMGSPDTAASYDILNSGLQVEYIEVFNRSDRRIDLNQVKAVLKRQDTLAETTFALSDGSVNCLEPKNVAVYSSTPIEGLPEGAVNINTMKGAITNSAQYAVSLVDKYAVTLDSVERSGNSVNASKGVSQTRNPQLGSNTKLVLHNDASVGSSYKNSVGYCSNGKLFIHMCE